MHAALLMLNGIGHDLPILGASVLRRHSLIPSPRDPQYILTIVFF